MAHRLQPDEAAPEKAEYWSWDFETFELLNGGVDDVDALRADWFAMLDAGQVRVPTGASDSHYRYIPCGLGRTDVYLGATDVGADVLKLDGGLALPSGASDADTRVVRALVLLAHALNMEVVAERVTGLEQLRRLRAAGCDLVQGHLVGKPCPADDLVVHMDL